MEQFTRIYLFYLTDLAMKLAEIKQIQHYYVDWNCEKKHKNDKLIPLSLKLSRINHGHVILK